MKPQYVIYMTKHHLAVDRTKTLCGQSCEGRAFDSVVDVFPINLSKRWDLKGEQRSKWCVHCAYRHIEIERLERLVLV